MRCERSSSVMSPVRKPEMICASSCSMRKSAGGVSTCLPPRNASICSKKCRRICAVKVNPECFRVALGIKMMRSAAVHQSDLSALGAVELVGLKVHRTRANVGQKEILMAFQMGDVAAVEKIIPRIVVIMSHAGDIVKQPPRRCGRR